MDVESFRRDGHQLIDWIADYLAHPERYPVLAQVEPGEVKARLPKEPPGRPEPMEAVLQDVEKIIAPGLTHWNHPGFFAYFGITGSGPGILGELLSSAFNVKGPDQRPNVLDSCVPFAQLQPWLVISFA